MSNPSDETKTEVPCAAHLRRLRILWQCKNSEQTCWQSWILVHTVFQNLERAYHDFHCQMTNVSALPSDPPPPLHPTNTSQNSQGFSGNGHPVLLDNGLSVFCQVKVLQCCQLCCSWVVKRGLLVLSGKEVSSCVAR